LPEPKLVTRESPYWPVIQPILDYVLLAEQEYAPGPPAVLLPRPVERRWYHYFLHNQRAELLASLLEVKSEHRINIVSVPWHLKA
jgi:hypothetical protein